MLTDTAWSDTPILNHCNYLVFLPHPNYLVPPRLHLPNYLIMVLPHSNYLVPLRMYLQIYLTMVHPHPNYLVSHRLHLPNYLVMVYPHPNYLGMVVSRPNYLFEWS